MIDCHDGLGQPWQAPLTTPLMDGVPVAQPLGPPPPATVVCSKGPLVGSLHKLVEPYVGLNPSKLESSAPAQESFHGISGM